MNKNTQLVCKNCMEDKRLRTQAELKDTPISDLVGKHIKIKFTDGGEEAEHMWVKVTSTHGNNIRGYLDNDPLVLTNWKRGDDVNAIKEDIEEVC